MSVDREGPPRQEEGVQEVGLRTLEGREGPRSEVVDRVDLLSSEEGVRRGSQGDELRGSGARGRAQVPGLLLDVPGRPDRGEGPGAEVEGWTVNSGKTGLPYFQVSHLGWKN